MLKRQTRILRDAAKRCKNDALAALNNLNRQRLEPDAHCLAALIQGSASRSYPAPPGSSNSSNSNISSKHVSFCHGRDAILEAEQWISMIKNVKPDSFVCNILLSSAAKCNAFDVLARTFLRMQTDWNIMPNEIAYTALAKACGDRNDPHGAEKWFTAMKRRKLKPTSTTYIVMIGMNIFSKLDYKILDYQFEITFKIQISFVLVVICYYRCLVSCRKNVPSVLLARQSQTKQLPAHSFPFYTSYTYEWLARRCIRSRRLV